MEKQWQKGEEICRNNLKRERRRRTFFSFSNISLIGQCAAVTQRFCKRLREQELRNALDVLIAKTMMIIKVIREKKKEALVKSSKNQLISESQVNQVTQASLVENLVRSFDLIN